MPNGICPASNNRRAMSRRDPVSTSGAAIALPSAEISPMKRWLKPGVVGSFQSYPEARQILQVVGVIGNVFERSPRSSSRLVPRRHG